MEDSRGLILNDRVSLKTLESYYYISVQLVAIHGERFLPLFERMRNELESKRQEHTLIDFAKKEVERLNK